MRPAVMTDDAARTVLVMGGSRDALPVLRALRRLGHRLVVADGCPDAPGFQLADAGLLAATLDPEAAIEAARAYASRTRVDAVLGTGRRLALSVAAVAKALSLAAVPVASARRLLDRLAVRACLHAAGLAVPPGEAVRCANDVRAARDRYGTPLLVQPVDGWAARGVVRIGPDVDPAWAFRVATTASPTGQVMCEPFIAGRSLAVVALAVGDETVVLDVAERMHEARFAPFVIASGCRGPCEFSATERSRIETLVREVVAALELRDALCTVELVVDGDAVTAVDVQVGLTNGRRLAHDIPLAGGIDPVDAAVRVALADPPEPAALRPRWCRPVVEVALFPAPGTVVGVHHMAAAAAADGVTLVDVSATPGSRVCPPTSNLCRGGVVVATGTSAEGALASARAAAARIRIVTEGNASARDVSLN
jgi:formate-dependent phosphoribosylglycinamide formyltransferase (GAR transformylase)